MLFRSFLRLADHVGDLFALGQLQQVDDVAALAGAAALGNGVAPVSYTHLYQNGIRDALCAAYRPILTAVWDIWLLTGGKSFRGGKDAELVRRGETFAVLEAVTQRTRQEDQEPDDPARVRITVGTPDAQRPGRYASVNGAPPKRAAGLAGSFPAVVFDPGHLSLVKGAPEGRRRFLDAALCQLLSLIHI